MTAFVVAQFAAVAPVVVAGWLVLSLTNSAAGSARTRRRCQVWTFAAGVAVLGGLVALVAIGHASTTTVARAGTGSVAWLFLVVWAFLAATRASGGGGRPLGPAYGAFPVRWLLPSAITPILTVLIGLIRFRDVPPTLTVHWTASGAGDRQVVPSLDTLFGLCTLQAMTAMTSLMIIGYGWRAGRGLAARRRVACGLLALAAGSQLSLAATSLILWRLLPPTGPGVAAVLLPFVGGFGVLAHRRRPVPTARGDARTATTA